MSALLWRSGAVACALVLAACSRKQALQDGPSEARRQTVAASKHLPDGCDAVVRIDLRRAFSHPSMAEHLSEVRARFAPTTTSSMTSTFFAAAALDPAVHLDDVFICLFVARPAGADGGVPSVRGPRRMRTRFVAAIGGRIVPETLLQAISAHAPPGRYTPEDVGGRPALRSPQGLIVSQAADAAILLASDRETLERGMHARSVPLPITERERGAELFLWSSQPGGLVGPGAGPWTFTHPVEGLLKSSRQLEIVFTAQPALLRAISHHDARPAAADAATRLEQLLLPFRDPGFRARAGKAFSAPVLGMLEKARVTAPDTRVVLEAPLAAELVGQFMHKLSTLGAVGTGAREEER